MEILIRIASGITNLWSLAAFGLAAVVYLLVKRRGTIPGLAWITIWILILAPIVVSAYSTISRTNMYRIRVTVVGAQGVPVEEAMVWSSAGGEPKKVSGGWEFDVPMASRPADGKIIFLHQFQVHSYRVIGNWNWAMITIRPLSLNCTPHNQPRCGAW